MSGIEGEGGVGRARDGGGQIAGGGEGHGRACRGQRIGSGAVLVAYRVGGANGGLGTGDCAGGGHEVCGLRYASGCIIRERENNGAPHRIRGVVDGRALCQGGGRTGHVPGDA